MKKFALVGGNKVANIVVAESAATIGPMADVFIVVDITDMPNPPSVGSLRNSDGTFSPELPRGVTLEVVEEEAPKSSSKKKASDETPTEE